MTASLRCRQQQVVGACNHLETGDKTKICDGTAETEASYEEPADWCQITAPRLLSEAIERDRVSFSERWTSSLRSRFAVLHKKCHRVTLVTLSV